MIDIPFYLIWGNQYIRKLIRNLLCQNYIIDVDKEYLIENHQYLSLFTNRDKLDYNIHIRFIGDASDYLNINNSHRNVINGVELELGDGFDLNEIHDGVHKLSLTTKDDTTIVAGKLPPSITFLHLSNDRYSCTPFVQPILSNLPANVQELILDIHGDSITSPCIMPESLTDIRSLAQLHYKNLKWFAVPPNKVYRSCTLFVDSMESFEWLFANKWITAIEMNVLPMLMSQRQLPSHITNLKVYTDVVQDTSFFPHTLETLTCKYGTPFSHLAQLQVLKITTNYQIKMEKGVLPSSLQELYLVYNHPLEVDVLPPHLTTLYLNDYDQPLCPNVLPPRLTTLYLYTFNQPLCPNVLPPSLTHLMFGLFSRPLNAFVLPQKLRKLYMQNCSQLTFPPNSLPVSLTDLSLYGLKGSFDQCQPLDNLKKLQVDSLDPSIATLLTNVKKLYLWVDNQVCDPSGIECLYNTSIKSLYLEFRYMKTLYPNSLPPPIKYLTLVNADLESDDVIPSGCISLKYKYIENMYR
ncbi:hypothetical protein CYY_000247 [Polysphondylium violaceum]|uniref:Uncharacterized protein n=1 Tax=Polysphondylium violaceum TaxID=133409 RepID=A0A8J4V979_9MYCE|nr:hypothetical protein CYY_000247 [Polysphondylium violaceum]